MLLFFYAFREQSDTPAMEDKLNFFCGEQSNEEVALNLQLKMNWMRLR